MEAELEGIRSRYNDKIDSITEVLQVARKIEKQKLSLIKPIVSD